MACPSMDALAAEYADKGVRSAFVYAREAHPGEVVPHHTSFEQKLAQAHRFAQEQHVQRPILVDTLDGAAHRAYGALPNMTWLLLRGGMVAYKAAWTDAGDVRLALENIDRITSLRRLGGRLAPFWTERLGFRSVDQAAFNRGLARNGPKAVAEFEAFTQRQRLDSLDE